LTANKIQVIFLWTIIMKPWMWFLQ
jgi:hypothetical protein